MDGLLSLKARAPIAPVRSQSYEASPALAVMAITKRACRRPDQRRDPALCTNFYTSDTEVDVERMSYIVRKLGLRQMTIDGASRIPMAT